MVSRPLSALKRARRDRLLDAAERVFQAEGFRGASMARIAEAAAMSKVTLYGYLPDKEAVFIAVAQRFADRLQTAFAAALQQPGDLKTRLGDALVGKHFAVSALVRQSPQAKDLFAAQARLSHDVYARADATMTAMVAEALDAQSCAEPRRRAALIFAATLGIANAVAPEQLKADLRFVVEKLLAD